MLIVKKLPADKYGRLDEIFRDEFSGSTPPLPENSDVLVAYDAGKMVGFVLVEDVKLIGQIYSTKDDKATVNALVKELKSRFDGKETVAAVASESRFERLFRSLGMYKMPGVFYRKNVDD